MLTVQRRDLILKMVGERSFVSVADLAALLDVSEVTVRKLLNDLDRQGLLRRARGGAISLTVPMRETDLRTKEKTNTSEKRAIAQKAYQLIDDQDTVFLDAGSTTLELARLIRDGQKRGITVATNAVNLAVELLDCYDIEVILIGGHLRHDVVSCVGPLAEISIGALHFDKAFMGANNVSLKQGATTPKLIEGQFKQRAIEASTNVYLICDSSKFGSASLSKICPVERFDAIITDPGLPQQFRKDLVAAGINLII